MKKLFVFVCAFGLVAAGCSAFANGAGEKDNNDVKDRGPLTKITFIHYKNDTRVNPAKPAKSLSCYGFLASGAKWKSVENFIINPTDSGLKDAFVKAAMDKAAFEWESNADPGVNFFGSSLIDSSTTTLENATDNKNVVFFAPYPDSNVIAVTSVWGYFGGAPKTRQIVEWDMQFNTKFQWGDATVDSALMDLQNIATHEIGHSAGMDDIYTTACNLETMYGYSHEGELIKRDLNTGDIAGIRALY